MIRYLVVCFTPITDGTGCLSWCLGSCRALQKRFGLLRLPNNQRIPLTLLLMACPTQMETRLRGVVVEPLVKVGVRVAGSDF